MAARSAVTAVVTKRLLMSKGLSKFEDSMQRIRDRSILAACATRVIAGKLSSIDPDEALLAGLVHDLGASYILCSSLRHDERRTRHDAVRHRIVQWHGNHLRRRQTQRLRRRISEASCEKQGFRSAVVAAQQ